MDIFNRNSSMTTPRNITHKGRPGEFSRCVPGMHDHIADQTGSLPNFSEVSSYSVTSSPKGCRRHRLLVNQKRSLDTILGSSLPHKHPPCLPRDPTQPSSGSISDVHSQHSVDFDEDEEAEEDFFPASFSGSLNYRPRSRTCPENRSWQRKVKSRSRSRPLTPPPPDNVGDSEVIQQMSKLVIREKLHLDQNELPLCIPENESEDINVPDDPKSNLKDDDGTLLSNGDDLVMFEMDD